MSDTASLVHPPQGPQVMGLHCGYERLQVTHSPQPPTTEPPSSLPPRKAHVSEGEVVIGNREPLQFVKEVNYSQLGVLFVSGNDFLVVYLPTTVTLFLELVSLGGLMSSVLRKLPRGGMRVMRNWFKVEARGS